MLYIDLKKCLNNKEHLNSVEKIYAIESHESVFLQLEDILMGGATAYKKNYGYNGKSLAKIELVKYLEEKLRHPLLPTNKNALKYNWFEIWL